MLQDVEKAAGQLNVRVIPVEGKGPGDIEKAFQLARHERVGGVLALPSPETWRAREQIARVALEHRLPTVGSEPDFAAAGNLVQYGPDFSESCRRAAFYVDRILKSGRRSDVWWAKYYVKVALNPVTFLARTISSVGRAPASHAAARRRTPR
jgi:putative tryptophan/tyrosine transport system substrate-binding protein